jgi:hypothetical protein
MSPTADFSKVLAYVLVNVSGVGGGAHKIGQAILQAYEYLIIRSTVEHVWVSQRSDPIYDTWKPRS